MISDRRRFVRQPIRLSCMLLLPSGMAIYGNTRDLSLDGITMEGSSFVSGKPEQLEIGDVGTLTLRYQMDFREESIKARCQVVHISGGGVGLNIRYTDLTGKDQEILSRILQTGSDQLRSRR